MIWFACQAELTSKLNLSIVIYKSNLLADDRVFVRESIETQQAKAVACYAVNKQSACILIVPVR